MKKKIGIIGGMGPAAGCDLHEKIISLSPATCDQEHLHVILDTNIHIADRTEYILDYMKQDLLNGGSLAEGGALIVPEILDMHEIHDPVAPSPRDQLLSSAKFLESIGCDYIAMPCVTAHYFEQDIIDSLKIPFVSITEVVAEKLSSMNINKAALLITDGSLCGQTFEPHLKKYHIEPVYPTLEEQKFIMDLVYKYIKPGNYDKIQNVKGRAWALLEHYKKQGADAFILGCTELPIAFKLLHINDKNLVDATYELAKKLVDVAYNN